MSIPVDVEYVYDETGDLRQIRTTWLPVVSWCTTYCIRWSMLVTGFSNTSIIINLYMYVYEAFDMFGIPWGGLKVHTCESYTYISSHSLLVLFPVDSRTATQSHMNLVLVPHQSVSSAVIHHIVWTHLMSPLKDLTTLCL